MSSVSGISPATIPIANQARQPVANQQPAPQPVPPVTTDADGDNDGTKGGKINTYA
jgi:hypothetical protein